MDTSPIDRCAYCKKARSPGDIVIVLGNGEWTHFGCLPNPPALEEDTIRRVIREELKRAGLAPFAHHGP